MPASLRFLLSDGMACNQIFYFSSESVSFPFTSISMRSPPYRIRWSSPFRRKGNSGMLRCCKVGASGFGENLHACARLRFAPGSIFPQKPCIRSSLPLWAPETKTTDATGRRIKKYRINERQISSETQLPQALGSALNIKTLRKWKSQSIFTEPCAQPSAYCSQAF